MIDESFLIPVPCTEAPLDAPALGLGDYRAGQNSVHVCRILGGTHAAADRGYWITVDRNGV
jgi:hypothetical protein